MYVVIYTHNKYSCSRACGCIYKSHVPLMPRFNIHNAFESRESKREKKKKKLYSFLVAAYSNASEKLAESGE